MLRKISLNHVKALKVKHSLLHRYKSYCKLENVRENLIFTNNIERHICDVKKSRTGHDLPISVNDRVISPIHKALIFTKLRICEVLQKLNSHKNFQIYSSSRWVQAPVQVRSLMQGSVLSLLQRARGFIQAVHGSCCMQMTWWSLLSPVEELLLKLHSL